MADPIDNSEDLIQVSDICERFEELESQKENAEDEDGDPDSFTDEDAEEFKTLGDLIDELRGYGGDHQWRGDWFPATLIRRSYFKDYAQELADDLHGSAMREASWPMNCIDWDKACRELEQDYSEVEIDGVEYLYR